MDFKEKQQFFEEKMEKIKQDLSEADQKLANANSELVNLINLGYSPDGLLEEIMDLEFKFGELESVVKSLRINKFAIGDIIREEIISADNCRYWGMEYLNQAFKDHLPKHLKYSEELLENGWKHLRKAEKMIKKLNGTLYEEYLQR